MRITLISCLILVLLPTAPEAQTWPAGTPVVQGLAVDLPPNGLQLLADTLGGQVPPDFPLGDMSGSSCCLTDPIFNTCLANLDYTVTNLWAQMSLQSINLVPEQDQLRADVSLSVVVNSSADPFSLTASGACGLAIGSCSAMWIGPITVDLSLIIKIDVSDPDGPGGTPPYFDATVPPPTHNLDTAISAADVHSNGCQVELLLNLADLLGLSLTDLLLGDIIAYVENDLPASVEAAVEAGFAAAVLEDVVDLQGALIHYRVYPDGVPIAPEGLRFTLGGEFDTPSIHPCVAPWANAGFVSTPSSLPGVAIQAPSGAPYNAGILLDDDLLNAAALAAWQGGLLCQTIDQELTGIALTTDFLATALGENVTQSFDRVFLEGPQELLVRTRPTVPPTVTWGGTSDAVLHIQDLGLAFHSVVLSRWTQLFNVAVDADVGLDFSFTPYGEIVISPSLDLSHLDPVVLENEIMPEINADLEAQLGPFLQDLVASVADGMLVPQYIGPIVILDLAIIDGEAAPVGAGDRLELFATIGTPIPGNSGGGSCSACDTSGCADPSTCIDPSQCTLSQSGARGPTLPAWALLLLPLLALLGLRKES